MDEGGDLADALPGRCSCRCERSVTLSGRYFDSPLIDSLPAPPVQTRPRLLYLSPNKTLVQEAPLEQKTTPSAQQEVASEQQTAPSAQQEAPSEQQQGCSFTYRHDPLNPVPTLGGNITSGEPIMVAGAFDQVPGGA